MKNGRRNHGAEFKGKVALEAIKGLKTIGELASEFQVHPSQIARWKKQAPEELPGLFSGHRQKAARADEELRARLYEQIGRLQVELEWLRKKCGV